MKLVGIMPECLFCRKTFQKLGRQDIPYYEENLCIDCYLRKVQLYYDAWEEEPPTYNPKEPEIFFAQLKRDYSKRLHLIREAMELSQTELGQRLINQCNKLFRKLKEDEAMEDYTKFKTLELLNIFSIGNRVGLQITLSIPPSLNPTLGDCRLFWTFKLLKEKDFPANIVQRMCAYIRGEKAIQELGFRFHKRPLHRDILTLIQIRKPTTTEKAYKEAKRLLTTSRPVRGLLYKYRGLEREELEEHIPESLTEILKNLEALNPKDYIIKTIEGELDWIPRKVKDRLIDKVRGLTAKKRMPTSLLKSLDEPPEPTVPTLEIEKIKREDIIGKPDSHIFLSARGEAVLERIDPLAPKIVVCILKAPRDITDKEIAAELGIKTRRVKYVRGKIKRCISRDNLIEFIHRME